MKVTKQQVNVLIMVLGVIIIALTYFYGVQKLNEKTEILEVENGQLRNEIDALQQLQLKQNSYIADTEMMKGLCEVIVEMFPSYVLTEDEIMYAVKLENQVGCYFSYVGTPVTENIDIPLGTRENILADLQDLTGAIAANSTVNQEQIFSTDGFMLGRSASTNTFTCTYDQFKELVKLIREEDNLLSIDEISLSYNNTTGSLSGNMTINYYSMSGTGRKYEPPRTGVAGYGVDCIFGAVIQEEVPVAAPEDDSLGEDAEDEVPEDGVSEE
ncbi:MAG: hypothetical protein HDQ98_14145 [Lachnospiraceae bacterium]|nr:hypothetical protein [Lachnospiraceae bacterium]